MQSIDDDVAMTLTEDGFDNDLMDEFAVDLSLSEMERIKKYVTATIDVQRLVHVRLMNDAIRKYPIEDIKDHILPLLEELSNDPVEDIRIELCGVFGSIIRVFAEENMEEGCGVAEGLILPLFSSMVAESCESEELWKAYLSFITVITPILPEDFLINHILSFIIGLMHSSNDAQQVFACRCIPCVVRFLSPTTNSDYLLSELSVIATIGSIEVLKALPAAAASLSGHIDTLCEPALVSLFQSFLAHSLWVVRKYAVAEVSHLVEGLSEKQQVVVLARFADMEKDTSKWVRQAVKEQIGYVLSCTPPSLVTEALLQLFCSVPDALEETEDFHLSSCCATTFPAVLAVLGAEQWPRLQPCFHRLTEIRINAVKQTLAASIGAVAREVGVEVVEKELLPLLLGYLNDDTAEVVIAALTSLPLMMKEMGEVNQVEIGKSVGALCLKLEGNTFNWRVQKQILSEVAACMEDSCKQVVVEFWKKVVNEGLVDACAVVREEAVKCAIVLMKRMSEREWREEVMEEAEFLVQLRERFYLVREGAVDVIAGILQNGVVHEEAKEELLNCLRALSTDKVVNVKELAESALLELTSKECA